MTCQNSFLFILHSLIFSSLEVSLNIIKLIEKKLAPRRVVLGVLFFVLLVSRNTFIEKFLII